MQLERLLCRKFGATCAQYPKRTLVVDLSTNLKGRCAANPDGPRSMFEWDPRRWTTGKSQGSMCCKPGRPALNVRKTFRKTNTTLDKKDDFRTTPQQIRRARRAQKCVELLCFALLCFALLRHPPIIIFKIETNNRGKVRPAPEQNPHRPKPRNRTPQNTETEHPKPKDRTP